MDSSVPLPSTGSFEDNITSLNRAATVHGSPSRSHQRRPSLPMSPSLLSTSPLLIPTSSSHRRQGSFAQETGRDLGVGSMGGGGSPSASMFLGGLMSSPGSGGVHRAASARDRSPSKGHHRKSSSISQSQTGISVPTSSYLGSSPRSSTFNPPAAALGALGRRRSYLEPARPEIKLDTASTGQRQPTQVLRQDNGKWLDVTGEEIVHGVKAKVGIKVVDEDLPMEQAVEALLADECTCLLVRKVDGDFAFFDFADLNTFLLLVLHATSTEKSRAPSRSLSISSARGHVRTTIDDIPSIDEHAVDNEELPSILDERSKSIVRRLRRNEKVSVGSICDISGKNPYTSYPASTSLRSLLPLFASGLHRIALTRADADPLVLADITVIEHLVSLKPAQQPPLFELAVTAPSAGFPLHPLISLPGTASVLDAMQVMSLNGLSGLGVLSGSGSGSSNSSRARRDSSGSSGSSNSGYVGGGVGWNPVHRSVSSSALTASPAVSPAADLLPMPNPFEVHGGAYGSLSGMEAGQLMSVVTAEECTRVVVPSEGKQVLGMGLGEMVRKVQYVEAAGRERGEERVPVHTIPYNSTILHAAHLILATSSSRVFLRPTPLIGASPPLSPTPSLSGSISSPPSSPSLSSLSLSESRGYISQPFGPTSSALPPPPPTQLSAHHVVSTLDILSCLARAYHGVLTAPPWVRAFMSQTRAPGQARTSLLSQRMQASTQGQVGGASPPGSATSGLPSGGSGRLSFKDADIAGARKEMEARPPQGQSVRSRIPRSKLRGSIMIMPSEVGGVAGWELDTEQIKQGKGIGRRQSQGSAARDRRASVGEAGNKKMQEGEAGAGPGGDWKVDQHKEGGGGGGYGGWRWAARVNEDG